MTKKLSVGIIGAGRIASVHVQSLAAIPEVHIAAIADIVLPSAQAYADQFGIAKVYDDYRKIIDDPAIDAVYIISSTDTHTEIMTAAAQAKKHIFCEKPIALDLKEIDTVLDVVKKSGVTLMVGFNRRYDAGNMELRKAVMDGSIGTPEMCIINSRDPAPPPMEYVKVSGGIFLDMMIHDFDLARYLLDDEPEEIFAQGACLIEPEIGKFGDYDTAMVTIRFKKGALCHIDNSRRAVYGYDQRAEVFGEKGKVYTANIHENNAVKVSVGGYSQPPIQNFFLERYLDAYRREAKWFVDCVTKGEKPLAGGLDGKVSVCMGYAAIKSAKEHRPVLLSEIC
ncbi:MAG: inositol 2-dehydrogenase [Planctomycetaceae bacterium]|nr:inositol 2-dehydrogenase [Planctomycetaceae bacterium]